jgi:hypothetical protein
VKATTEPSHPKPGESSSQPHTMSIFQAFSIQTMVLWVVTEVFFLWNSIHLHDFHLRLDLSSGLFPAGYLIKFDTYMIKVTLEIITMLTKKFWLLLCF